MNTTSESIYRESDLRPAEILKAIVKKERQRRSTAGVHPVPIAYPVRKSIKRLSVQLAELAQFGHFSHCGFTYYAENNYTIKKEGANQGGKITKAIAKIYRSIPPHILAVAINTTTASCYRQGQLQIWEGEDIPDLYKSFDDAGIGACMSGSWSSKYTLLYAANPEKVKLAVYADQNGHPLARRLIWYTDGKIWLDRQYPNHSTRDTEALEAAILKHHATRAEDIRIRHSTGLPRGKVVFSRPDGSIVRPDPITLDRHEDTDSLPYVDTWHWIQSIDCSEITLQTTEIDCIGELSSTDGEANMCCGECSECGDMAPDSQMEELSGSGSVCRSCYEDAPQCERCNSRQGASAEWQAVETSIGCQDWCEGCAENHAAQCDYDSEVYALSEITDCNGRTIATANIGAYTQDELCADDAYIQCPCAICEAVRDLYPNTAPYQAPPRRVSASKPLPIGTILIGAVNNPLRIPHLAGQRYELVSEWPCAIGQAALRQRSPARMTTTDRAQTERRNWTLYASACGDMYIANEQPNQTQTGNE